MNIVVTGCGKIGSAIIRSLVSEGHDITAIDIDPYVVQSLGDMYDIMTLSGNGVDRDILDEAGVARADLFIAATNSDEMNMLSCFLAGRIGAKNTLARIRNPEYNDRNLGFLVKQTEISRVLNPELLAAQAFFNILRFPSAIKIETFSTRKFEMIEMVLKPDSKLDGMSLSELRKKYKSQVLICGVQREDDTFIPDGNFRLKSGDRIELASSPVEIQKFLKELGSFQKQARNIIILGGGRITRYLADMLIGIGNSVKIIEQDKKICEELSEMLPQAEIIEGNGARHDLLIEEGVAQSDAFVALTGMDEENILISIYAMNQGVPTVLAKVNNEEMVSMAEKLGLDCIVTPASIISGVAVQYARALENTRGNTVKTLYKILDGKVEALEFNVFEKSGCVNVPLKNLKIKDDVLIAGIVRERRNIVPSGNDVILPGDTVIIVAYDRKINDLDDIMA